MISLRLGERDEPPGYLRRYRTGAVGAHYGLRRNLRLLGELGWDLDADRARLTTGVIAAF